jgi:hypothetical protein
MPTKIRLLADKNILIHKNYIPCEIEMDTYNPAGGIPSDVNKYDALLVRTVNPVDKTTIPLKNSRLKFIGSATAGIDHIDIQWLKECGITFAHSRAAMQHQWENMLRSQCSTGHFIQKQISQVCAPVSSGQAIQAVLPNNC